MIKNIILFGPPGCGKGTQAKLMSKFFGFLHLSTGDLFRKNIINKTFLGQKTKNYLNQGVLVPDIITINMIENEIKNQNIKYGLIYDGYPRTLNQAKILDHFLKINNLGIINFVFFLNVNNDILIDRINKRSKSSGRLDDKNIEIIYNRIKEYNLKTKELIKYYDNQGFLIKIQAENNIYNVNNQINKIILNNK